MKRFTSISRLVALLIIFTGFAFTSYAQEADAVFTKVSQAIQSQDAAAMATYFHTNVEITTPDADGAYASNQAQFVLKDFFAKNPGTGFRVVHKGSSGSTFYATGSYTTKAGNFDTNIFVKNIGGKYVITQIRFEAE
ncbi:MAG: DUF4783 domain-containing protein [Bacteroidia bacterium]|nr:DUF4783 domain-containing protein [Bacteroidia bacterium]